MLLSLNWIKEYIDLPEDVTAEKLAHDLTMATVEVEEVIDQAKAYKNIVVGVIKEVKSHPDADKLKLTMTDIGNGEIKQIVCGGSNLAAEMKVVVALPGAKVRWHGEGNLVELAQTKIRGAESFGMICAAAEVNLQDLYKSEDEREIVDLGDLEAVAGTPLAEALGRHDLVIEIDNKSLTNRPDLWCHYGIARELAAIYNLELKNPELENINFGSGDNLKIKINSEDCYRYVGLLVNNIKIQASPEWLKNRLVAVGINPINNIVDITNYVMLDLGEPTHAFTADKVKGVITARAATAGEKLELLGGEEIELSSNDLVIADDKSALALAGIKGGEKTSIKDDTTSVIFEAATFSPLKVRRSATRLEVRTDASARHEKGIDTQRAALAIQRIVTLLKKVQPVAEIIEVVDVNPNPTQNAQVTVTREFITSRLGQDLSAKEIINILEKLKFTVTQQEDNFTVTVPSWRATGDISLPEDIVEEIARIYGYDNLQRFVPVVNLDEAVMQIDKDRLRAIKEFLAATASLHEVYNYPWAETKILKSLKISEDDLLEIACPPSEEQKFLQNTLLPNLISTVKFNTKNLTEFGIFEIARVFNKKSPSEFSQDGENLPYQPKHLAGAVVGLTEEDVYARAKGICEVLIKKFHIPTSLVNSDRLPVYVDQFKAQALVADDEYYGFVGLLRHQVMDQPVCFFEINISEIQKLITIRENQYKPLPQFPSIERDIAIEIDNKVKWQEIKDLVTEISPLLTSVELFDIYKGKHISEGKKSVAFRMEFYSPQRTLTSVEVEKIEQELIEKLNQKFQAILRT